MKNNNPNDLVKLVDEKIAFLSSEIESHKNDFNNLDYHDAYPKMLKTLKDTRILINFTTSDEDKIYILHAAMILTNNEAEGIDRFAATKKIMELADKYNIYGKELPKDPFSLEEVKTKGR